jgi:fumarate hydratase class II
MAGRKVQDSMGALEVPGDALWGAQTQRALQNFGIGGAPMPKPFVHALLVIKQCAARANHELGAPLFAPDFVKTSARDCAAAPTVSAFTRLVPAATFPRKPAVPNSKSR